MRGSSSGIEDSSTDFVPFGPVTCPCIVGVRFTASSRHEADGGQATDARAGKNNAGEIQRVRVGDRDGC
jgi:hypothetical protein